MNGVHPSPACPVSSTAFLIYTAITTAGQICSVRLSMDTWMQSHHRSHLQCHPVAKWLDSHAENHGCIWKKAGPLPQNIGHAVNRILTRPRGSPPMTDDEACQWAEISQDATESLEPNLSAAFYKAGFIPQPGHPGGTLALSQDFPRTRKRRLRATKSWAATKNTAASKTRTPGSSEIQYFLASSGSSSRKLRRALCTWLSTKPSEPVQPV
jgi:hypothetical protein